MLVESCVCECGCRVIESYFKLLSHNCEIKLTLDVRCSECTTGGIDGSGCLIVSEVVFTLKFVVLSWSSLFISKNKLACEKAGEDNK